MKKSVLITGGGRRIGACIARKLALAGFRVVVHLRRSLEEGGRLAAGLREAGCEVALVQGRLETPEAAEALFASALEPFGCLDALVNNASSFVRLPLSRTSPRDFEEAWRLNTLAPIVLTQSLAAHLGERGERGAVVNLLDQRIARPNTGNMAYLLSKKGMEAFTLSAALELAPLLRINGVAPGAVLTPEMPAGSEPSGGFPLGRRPLPGEIAEAVLFLLQAPSITGQILYVDGGQHLA